MNESLITRTSLLTVIQRAEAALPTLKGLASCTSPIGLRENNALYFELTDTALRAEAAGTFSRVMSWLSLFAGLSRPSPRNSERMLHDRPNQRAQTVEYAHHLFDRRG
jgi:hypothetical protein